jgi:hypothetical protein
VSYTTPLLFASPLPETDAALAIRQAALSDVELYADACTTGAGIGLYAPGDFTAFVEFSLWRFVLTSSGTLTPNNINILEFTGAVLLAVVYIIVHQHDISTHPTPFHIHIWTDNMAAYWFIRRNRAAYPVSIILLQMLALLQLRYRVIITIGHIPGQFNIYADAISRWFRVPDGPALRRFLQPLPHYPLGGILTPIFAALALNRWRHPSSSLAAGLIVLESITGLISALPTVNL